MDLIFLFTFLCGLTTAIIAHTRNRSWFWWYCIGVVMNVFALILVLALPPLPPKPKPQQPSADRLEKIALRGKAQARRWR